MGSIKIIFLKGERELSTYNFMIRKIHSLLGIIPIGVFILVHLAINSTSLASLDTYQGAIATMKGLGILVNILEVVVIALPLLFHALYGIYIVYVARNNALGYTYYRNWAFYLQRITALITFVFLIWHVYQLRLSQEEPALIMKALIGTLQNPVFFVLYIIGVVSAIYHFSNGIATFFMSWGITVGPKSQNILTIVSLAIFAAVSVWAIAILFKLQGYDITSLALLAKGGM